jgi:hypothetical protein
VLKCEYECPPHKSTPAKKWQCLGVRNQIPFLASLDTYSSFMRKIFFYFVHYHIPQSEDINFRIPLTLKLQNLTVKGRLKN